MAETNIQLEQTSKGLVFGKETLVRIPPRDKDADKEVYAICLKTDDDDLLYPKKVYKIRLQGDRACVIDEEGEVAIYPMDFFLVLSLSPTAQNTLAEVLG
jgi:hypothetical protein